MFINLTRSAPLGKQLLIRHVANSLSQQRVQHFVLQARTTHVRASRFNTFDSWSSPTSPTPWWLMPLISLREARFFPASYFKQSRFQAGPISQTVTPSVTISKQSIDAFVGVLTCIRAATMATIATRIMLASMPLTSKCIQPTLYSLLLIESKQDVGMSLFLLL